MNQIDDEKYAEIQESLSSFDILDAVASIDIMRGVLSDDGRDCRPPEIRDKLFKLHSLGMDFLNRGMRDKADDFFALNNEIYEELCEVQEAMGAVLKILATIEEQRPDEDMDDEEC